MKTEISKLIGRLRGEGRGTFIQDLEQAAKVIETLQNSAVKVLKEFYGDNGRVSDEAIEELRRAAEFPSEEEALEERFGPREE